jgi:hypothetical protein
MLMNMYIKATAGLLRWALLAILKLAGPLVKLPLYFFSLGGVLAIIFGGAFLAMKVEPPHGDWTPVWVLLALGGLSALALLKWDDLVDRLTYDRLWGDDDQEREPWNMARAGGVVALAGFYATLAFCSAKWYHISDVAAIGVGFVWFLGLGTFLGIARWISHGAAELASAVNERHQKQKPAPVVAEPAANDAVVVEFPRSR